MIEPVHGLLHGFGRQLAGDRAAHLLPREKTRILEHVEMLHDRRERHRKGPGKLADRQAVARIELSDQRAPRGIGKRSESAVKSGVLILNHVVKCMPKRKGLSIAVSARICAAVKAARVVDSGSGPFYGPPGLGGLRVVHSEAPAISRQAMDALP
jgi:hypothetical protein